MRPHTRDFLVGLTTIGALVTLATLLMLFGELDRWIRDQYAFTVRIDNAGGLFAGSAVRLNGVNIGVVEKVEIDPADAAHPVVIRIRVDGSRRIPDPVVPAVETSLLGGAATLTFTLTPESVTSGRLYAVDGSAVVTGTYQTLADRLAAMLDERLAPINQAAASFAGLGTTFDDLSTQIGQLIGEATTDDPEAPTLRNAIRRVDRFMTAGADAADAARTWLDDEALRADVTGSISDFRAMTTDARTFVASLDATNTSLQAAIEDYRRLAGALEGDAHSVASGMLPLMDDVGRAFEEMRILLAAATSGDGTIGHLLTDPTLYESLSDAATRLDQALRDAQLLIQKIQAEGLRLNL
ncbi:MAG: MCE family protein [Phycisphaerales bacterium]|nr:MCE family protein [Phycisphaerales bacterium]